MQHHTSRVASIKILFCTVQHPLVQRRVHVMQEPRPQDI